METKGLKVKYMNSGSIKYQKQMLNPITYWFGMLYKLPSIIFWGVLIKSLTKEKCEITIPYSWRTQNPFKSIYFAALAGAAELSTGALCQMLLADRVPHSMLVVDFKAEYYKKASSKIVFTCTQGNELNNLLNSLLTKGDSEKLQMISVGTNLEGEIISKVFVTWSFKRKG